MEGQYNLRSPAVKRLMREAKELSSATPLYHAQPLEDNLFEWHFTVSGPKETAFEGGRFHGRILLPPEYPMKPPSIIMLTPNGRFEVSRKICLSMSAYHPELWQPSWSIRTALLAIIGFMPTEGGGAIGSLDYTAEERKRLAKRSMEWQCQTCGAVVKDVLAEDDDEEQRKKMNSEAADVAAQMSFKSEEETKKALENLKQQERKTEEENKVKEESQNPSENGETEELVEGAKTENAHSNVTGATIRRRNIKETTSSEEKPTEGGKPNASLPAQSTSRRPKQDGSNVTSLLVLWALIAVIVLLALRRLLYM